jgi:hypothetical protein
MDAAAVLADLRYRGIVLIPNGSDRLIARPGSRLTDADREAIRRHKSELLQLLTSPNDDYDDLIFTSSLAALADAIASAPRSPFLDDLAIARAARAYIESVRAIRGSSYEVRREAS